MCAQGEEIIRLLEAGKNVISINGYGRPQFWEGGRYEALLEACRKGNQAERLGLTLDRIETDHHRVLLATKDLVVAAGTIPQGMVSHIHFCWHGIVNGRPKLTMSIHWYMETTHLNDWTPPLWQIKIDGQPASASRWN